MHDESLRELAARLIREHREKKDEGNFRKVVEAAEVKEPEPPAEEPIIVFDGIDREFLRQCGVEE